MFKRRRILLREVPASVQSLDKKVNGGIPALTCVLVVCRNGSEVLRLPKVIGALHGFLDWSSKWTLTRATNANFFHLLVFLLAKEVLEPADSSKRDPRFRQWVFSECVMKAVVAGNLNVVQLLSTHFMGCHLPSSVVIEAVKLGKTEILQWFSQHRNDTRCNSEAVSAAIEGNHFELAQQLKEKLSTITVAMVEKWAAVAAGTGNLDMLQWICSLSGDARLAESLQKAVDAGNVATAKRILNQLDKSLVASSELRIHLDKATTHCHYAMIEWLTRGYPTKCRIDGADCFAAKTGDLAIVRCLRENKIDGCSDRIMNFAAEGGQLAIVKWLHEHVGPLTPGRAIDFAAQNGFLDVVKFLHEKTSERCTTEAMDGAAEKGHLEVVQWLSENRSEGCTPRAMNLAAALGHLEVVKWLHSNRQEGCTQDAMNKAASNGHLNVVQWLHFNSSVGCTHDAMNGAAENGHLKVVEWLHENRSEGCTTLAMDAAARNNHLKVVIYLHFTRGEGCTVAAIDGAAAKGNLDMVVILHHLRFAPCTTDAMDGAVRNGHFKIAFFLHDRREECNIVESFRECPNPQRRWEFAEWMHANHRDDLELAMLPHLFVY